MLTAKHHAQVRHVDQTIVHERYNKETEAHDIALVHLKEPLNLSTERARPIPLVTRSDRARGLTAPGQNATVSGWGALVPNGSTPSALHAVTLPIVSRADAQLAYSHDTITHGMLAAGLKEGGKDACQGDSGGPLVVRDPRSNEAKLAGIVSWGRGCAQPNRPGMYTRVSSYHDWIVEVVGDLVLAGPQYGQRMAWFDFETETNDWFAFGVGAPHVSTSDPAAAHFGLRGLRYDNTALHAFGGVVHDLAEITDLSDFGEVSLYAKSSGEGSSIAFGFRDADGESWSQVRKTPLGETYQRIHIPLNAEAFELVEVNRSSQSQDRQPNFDEIQAISLIFFDANPESSDDMAYFVDHLTAHKKLQEQGQLRREDNETRTPSGYVFIKDNFETLAAQDFGVELDQYVHLERHFLDPEHEPELYQWRAELPQKLQNVEDREMLVILDGPEEMGPPLRTRLHSFGHAADPWGNDFLSLDISPYDDSTSVAIGFVEGTALEASLRPFTLEVLYPLGVSAPSHTSSWMRIRVLTRRAR